MSPAAGDGGPADAEARSRSGYDSAGTKSGGDGGGGGGGNQPASRPGYNKGGGGGRWVEAAPPRRRTLMRSAGEAVVFSLVVIGLMVTLIMHIP
ncbi:hypothetical protein Hte_007657 [Hypoxylon texense]